MAIFLLSFIFVSAYIFNNLKLFWLYVYEKEMATHYNIFAFENPQTEEPDRLQFMGSQRVGHWLSN